MTVLRRLATAAAGLGGLGVLCVSAAADGNFVHAAQIVTEKKRHSSAWRDVAPEPPTVNKWDYNWDRREPSHIVEPSKGGGDDDRYKMELQLRKPRATRHLFLIRHGQYNLDGRTDKERSLTAKGFEQARATGKRLVELNYPFELMVRSTMTRALQTGEEILAQMKPGSLPFRDDNMLMEGAPCRPEPPSFSYKPESYEYFQDGSRIEAAFRNYVYRADYKQTKDSYEILVCHGNVIRYFVCRALQLPPEAWLRINLSHASITWLSIMPSGFVSLRCLGDTGHMAPNLISN
ncbi:Serine/threonine-protein phosphatase PGAM5, mitochondrial [Frankliniella fusca]|uniref:Serine/threonine-protein phosphatase PGAM5, mitochondrial n=1 Tax=Frankliniella fusca TaxID=407009 RepID=A0AAE1LM83_9NEOP|nr:Serine/threonine-protein phosphatase PGAM5, mitochondrial [Frankliniella fusca]